MDIFNSVFEIVKVFFVIIALGIGVNFLTTFIHELGHAIPSLLFTRDPVHVLIGTYKQEEATIHFRIARLSFSLTPLFSPFSVGLCRHAGCKYWWQSFLITISGALVTFFTGLLFFIWIIQGHFTGVGQIFGIIFFGLSVIQLFSNLVPSSQPIETEAGGQVTYNDGYILREIIRKRYSSEEYREVMDSYEKKDFGTAAQKLTSWRTQTKITKSVFQLGQQVYLAAKAPDDLIDLYFDYVKRYPSQLKAQDYFVLGEAYFLKRDFNNCLKYNEEGLYYEPFNKQGFLNIARLYDDFGQEGKAEEYYQKVRNLSV